MAYQLKQCTEAHREWAFDLKSEAYRKVVERQFGLWDEELQRAHFGTRWNPRISKIVLLDGSAVGLVAVEERAAELCRRMDFALTGETGAHHLMERWGAAPGNS
jgi:hypothetical protein